MLSEDKVIALYCITDDLLKGIGHREDSRRKVSDSEVITTALVCALYFGGHQDNGRQFMKMTKLIFSMPYPRYNRRLHQLSDLLFSLFFQIGDYVTTMTGAGDYVIDSFLAAVCDNICIPRSRIIKSEQWKAKQTSRRRYFYGVKVQVLTTAQGIPVECCFVPGSESDVQALKKLPLAIAAQSRIYADAAYTDYTIEDDMKQADTIELMIQRKKNAKRKDEPWIRFIKEQMRKGIETTFSEIKALFLRTIHAVTCKGFLIKLILFIIAFTIDKLS